ncbi:MAG: hypothetical protein SVK08_12300, partial [Halobacteriota archaeon]|nr:hypothetical protein [Halobacteriota archaeon]
MLFRRKGSREKSDKLSQPLSPEPRDVAHVTHERPRICLIDIKEDIAHELEASSYNCYQGTLGSLERIPQNHFPVRCLLHNDFPDNLHEYDMVILDLLNQNEIDYQRDKHIRREVKGNETYYLEVLPPRNLFDPRPLAIDLLSKELHDFPNKDSIVIIFAGQDEEIEYNPLLVSRYGEDRKESTTLSLLDLYPMPAKRKNMYGMDCKVALKGDSELSQLIQEHCADAKYHVTFNWPQIRNEQYHLEEIKNFRPLMESSSGAIISFAQKHDNCLVLSFPEIHKQKEFLLRLLNDVLPELKPSLFPYSTKFAWLKDSNYWLPNEKELQVKRKHLEQQYQDDLAIFRQEERDNYLKYKYLHDILKDQGSALVEATCDFLRWLEFENVTNMDDQQTSNKQEDIRVVLSDEVLLIEVKGIGGDSKDRECSQVN